MVYDELKETFIELYHEWFQNKKHWFDKNAAYDKYLSEKYFPSIKDIKVYQNELSNDDKYVQIGAIIALDQIPRHHNRLVEVDVHMYSKIASDIAVSFISAILQDKFQDISAHEWCFIFLPIRHVHDMSKIQMIIKFVIEKA